MRETLPIAAIGNHGIESIDHANDSGNQRDIVPFQSCWIPTPIHALVMMKGIQTRLFESGKRRRIDQLYSG